MVVFTKAHGARPSIRLRANPAKLSAIARTRSVRAGLLEGGSAKGRNGDAERVVYSPIRRFRGHGHATGSAEDAVLGVASVSL